MAIPNSFQAQLISDMQGCLRALEQNSNSVRMVNQLSAMIDEYKSSIGFFVKAIKTDGEWIIYDDLASCRIPPSKEFAHDLECRWANENSIFHRAFSIPVKFEKGEFIINSTEY